MTLTDVVVKQILTVRGTGKANMFDVAKVGEIAKKCGFFELLDVLKNHKNEYCEFILFGNRR